MIILKQEKPKDSKRQVFRTHLLYYCKITEDKTSPQEGTRFERNDAVYFFGQKQVKTSPSFLSKKNIVL